MRTLVKPYRVTEFRTEIRRPNPRRPEEGRNPKPDQETNAHQFGVGTLALFRVSAFGSRPSWCKHGAFTALLVLGMLACPVYAEKVSSPSTATKQLVIRSATVGGKALTWRPGNVLR